jgi:uncharacterized protein
MRSEYPKSNLLSPLSEAELNELDQFLISDNLSGQALWLDALDGYLTAVVIAPARLSFDHWFSGIWGGSRDHIPKFESMEKAQHIVNLIMRHMNSIKAGLERDPDHIELLFETLVNEENQQEYLDAKMWARGFLCGIELCKNHWLPLFDDPDGQEAFYPIYLLGTDNLPNQETVQIETQIKRAALTDLVPLCVATIYRFWLPYRTAIG